jgi:NDP-sugar pyrophosphorylase family protein
MSLPPVAILSGGLGTRLYPLTEQKPKALVEILGEPFIAHQLRLLRDSGIENVVLCVGRFADSIRDYVKDGSRFDVRVQYSMDGPVLLGTAGAVRKAISLLGGEFFVMYGDSYLPCDYRSIASAFRSAGKPALMTVFRNEGKWDASNVAMSDGVIKVYDKKNRTAEMHHIDYGLGVFRASAFEQVPLDTAFDLATLYQQLLKQAELAAYVVPQRFYEAGSFQGIEELKTFLSVRKEL